MITLAVARVGARHLGRVRARVALPLARHARPQQQLGQRHHTGARFNSGGPAADVAAASPTAAAAAPSVTTVCGTSGARTSTGAVAVYLDLDNIMASHIAKTSEKHMYDEEILVAILDECARYGKVVVRRAYGDAVRFAKLRRTMALCGIEMLDLAPHGPQQKNSGDIKLVVDALEAALAPAGGGVDTFVIASGDSDFTPLLAKLRSYGKGTVMMSRSTAMSSLLPAYCDRTVTLEELLARSPSEPGDLNHLVKNVHIAQPDTAKPVTLQRLEKQLGRVPRKLQTALGAILLRHETRELLRVREDGSHTYVSLTPKGLKHLATTSFTADEMAALIDSRLIASSPALNFDPVKHQAFVQGLHRLLTAHAASDKSDSPGLEGKHISKQLRADMPSANSESRLRFSALFVERTLLTLLNAGLLARMVTPSQGAGSGKPAGNNSTQDGSGGGGGRKTRQFRPNTQHMQQPLAITPGIVSLEDFRERLDRYVVHTVLANTVVRPTLRVWENVLYNTGSVPGNVSNKVLAPDFKAEATQRLQGIVAENPEDRSAAVAALVDSAQAAASATAMVTINVSDLEKVEAPPKKKGLLARLFNGLA